jgi:hypothetical protein
MTCRNPLSEQIQNFDRFEKSALSDGKKVTWLEHAGRFGRLVIYLYPVSLAGVRGKGSALEMPGRPQPAI